MPVNGYSFNPGGDDDGANNTGANGRGAGKHPAAIPRRRPQSSGNAFNFSSFSVSCLVLPGVA